MTEESLADYITRLEQENKELYENGQIEITKLCNEKTKYRSALEEIREIAQHCIRQDVCALCDHSKECAVLADGLVYDNNRLLIKLINEVL